MKRVKLIELSESVQVVLIKDQNEQEQPSIKFTFYGTMAGALFQLSAEWNYESIEKRDEVFEQDKSASLKRIFNNVVTTNNLPLETIN